MHHERAQHEQAARRAGRAKDHGAGAAFDAGDYKTALRLYLQVMHSGADTQVGQLALARAQSLQTDPVAVGAGFATLILVATAAVWALSN